MSYSVMELWKNTTRVREVAELVQVVLNAISPTEAEACAKDLEYPSNLVRETRLLALVKRDHGSWFEQHLTMENGLNVGYQVDPWRYFDCTFTRASVSANSVPANEEHGILGVKPFFPFPPLFWVYVLYDADGEKLFSFEDGAPAKQNFLMVVQIGSKSIPVGLKITIWGESHLIEFSSLDSRSRQVGHWTVHASGWPTKSEYRYQVEGGNTGVCFRPVMEEDKLGRRGPSEQYVLEITDFESRNGEIVKERLWMFEKYTLQGLYSFVSPWEDVNRFSQFGGRQIVRNIPSYMTEIVSLKHSVSNEGPIQEQQPRPIDEVVSAMLRGIPSRIQALPTLHNLFSFKHAHTTCYNVGDEVPLVA